MAVLTLQRTGARRLLTAGLAATLLLASSPPALADGKPKPDRPDKPARPQIEEAPWEHETPFRRDKPTPEETQKMLDVLREMEPELAERIDKWRQENPDRVADMLQRRFPRLRMMIELQKFDPEQFKLRMQDLVLSRQLLDHVRAYRAARLAKDGKPEEVREQIRRHLVEQFEVRQKIRQRELERLEQRLRQLRKELDERAKTRDKVIDREVSQLLDDRK